jgi:adenylate cyclase
MLSRIVKGALLGVGAGIVGCIASLTPFGLSIEENLGLEILFHLRGHRTPPPEVVVVSIDKESSDRFDLPNTERKFPRSLHADLTEKLSRRGAAVIAFDLFFEDPGVHGDDRAFAAAMRSAGNVVLCERLQFERVSLTDRSGTSGGVIEISRRIPPISLFEAACAASTPYPLPRVPAKVFRDWTFRTTAENFPSPTLPVVAFQMYALPAYADLRLLLEEVFPADASRLPRSAEEFLRERGIKGMILELREIFEKDPSAERRLLAALDGSPSIPADPKRRRILRSLIRLYGGGTRKILNFYGPTRTIPTIPYYLAIQPAEDGEGTLSSADVAGKAVFVGSSENRDLAQKDGFHTVYTTENGVDLSGVEIEATSFANLLEDMPLRPLPLGVHVSGMLLWGLAAGVLSFISRPAVSFPAVAALSALYLGASVHQFAVEAAWYPVFFPLLVQGPMALGGSVAWNYVELNRERRNFRRALADYLPAGVVDDLAKNIEGLRVGNRLVNGICLATDAERYTALAESMAPKELAQFMNRYYEAVFDPVRRHGGMVSNVVGDSMLALWLTTREDPAPLNDACLAAIEISNAMREFRGSHDGIALPTRIGLHAGEILLGNIGAGQHFEYRPVGDIVNTATRIEGLNKYLGTRILVSRDVVPLAGIFLARDMGRFLLVGKSRPVHVCELVTLLAEATPLEKEYCASFAEGLELFRRQAWEKGTETFQKTLGIREGDGPSLFYLRLCALFSQNPPGEGWDGVVQMEKK